uniref:Uncharacterized protein n=1 Tax=Arion vulgaris TaxID=1028688 RepID=A0A0B6Y9F7_9EUPU
MRENIIHKLETLIKCFGEKSCTFSGQMKSFYNEQTCTNEETPLKDDDGGGLCKHVV